MVTIFCDIDGTLIDRDFHIDLIDFEGRKLLPGVKEALDQWNRKEYNLILTTGRRECLRKETEDQLKSLGVSYDQLVMGLRGWPRVLINDKKSDGSLTAFAINLDRNKGFSEDIINI